MKSWDRGLKSKSSPDTPPPPGGVCRDPLVGVKKAIFSDFPLFFDIFITSFLLFREWIFMLLLFTQGVKNRLQCWYVDELQLKTAKHQCIIRDGISPAPPPVPAAAYIAGSAIGFFVWDVCNAVGENGNSTMRSGWNELFWFFGQAIILCSSSEHESIGK